MNCALLDPELCIGPEEVFHICTGKIANIDLRSSIMVLAAFPGVRGQFSSFKETSGSCHEAIGCSSSGFGPIMVEASLELGC